MTAPVLSAAERKAFEAFVSTYSLEEPAPLDTWFAARNFYVERERVLREALRFYADGSNYVFAAVDETGDEWSSPAHEDEGETARAALASPAPQETPR